MPDERQPLLQPNPSQNEEDEEQKVEFGEKDPEDPQQWPGFWKYAVVGQVSLIAFFLPMASSIYAPASDIIASEFETSSSLLLLHQTGYVCMLGIGPLFHAPMSETFGRRIVYLISLCIFTLLQIPVALSPNVESFIVLRTLSGFFASVGVGNGGGSISDMLGLHERAKALGFYMIFPLLAPTIGPFISGLMVDRVDWRWLSWLNMLLAALTTILCYFFLYETRAVTILQQRQKHLQKKHPHTRFFVGGASNDSDSFVSKVGKNSTRAVKILFTQPIVLIMSIYQALVFSTMYSLYAKYSTIWQEPPYEFTKTQVGLAYLAPAVGFITAGFFLVLFVDRLYNYIARLNDDEEGRPEYRLPLATLGSVSLPISLFWFGWAIEKDASWPIPLIAMVLFGVAQVSIFNPVQTYYIDAYPSNAASAVAAGAFLRSIVGGIVPLFVGPMFDKLGYGLGLSVFGILAVILMPAPVLFYYIGQRLREKFPFKG
ncbi:uncharacterized protein MYCFIDRAFT_45414 [Pseudocercospora fijiensis CIRAD86]|uniref:Major facilitator superfamily (MFS) profile domain-containing protein n=1 Tax=Pseudocercospora fijiensis (strain CIRAD86) TaxID=383855 RepID=M3APC3_PSEFD|nr:uncharacterized protein MYCFIDRAFT_45414 [Pseudocercospora fijiensis CIRAD86]EME86461.1 hypothetical protein MYCFIDRAFT_45414 [Pseudocercospora fijiensis CIRAD86]